MTTAMTNSRSLQPNSSYFYDQLEDLAAQQKKSADYSADNSDTESSDEQPASVPDQDCRKAVQEDHPFLKYAVKLGYQLSLAEDALARLGSSATTDSLLSAVLYDYAALNPRKNRHSRRNYNNCKNQFNSASQKVTNGKPYPSYMITQDSYQFFKGHHRDVTALKSALSQGPGNQPYSKTISPPNSTTNNSPNGNFYNGAFSNSRPTQNYGYSNLPARNTTLSSNDFFNAISRTMSPSSHEFFNPPSTTMSPSSRDFFNPPSRTMTLSSQEFDDQLTVNSQPFQPFGYSL